VIAQLAVAIRQGGSRLRMRIVALEW